MKHVVALSGGKDSTAMALRLSEIEPRDYIFVCTPTSNEPPEMFEHWKRLGALLGIPIIPIIANTLDGLITKQNALPNWRQRWCTRMLKIEPFVRFIAGLGECTSYIGVRVDEDVERGLSEYRGAPNCTIDFPLRRWHWTLHDVRSYLAKRGVEIPRRTDCLKCFFQRLDEWYEFWRSYPEEWMKGEAQEAATGHTFRSPGKDNWPVAMKDMRAKFEIGEIPKKANKANQRCLICRI